MNKKSLETWSNRDNRHFYSKCSSGWLLALSETRRLLSCPDLAAICDLFQIPETENVLEIGAGTGRVVRWIRQRFPELSILAMEPKEAFVDILRTEFQSPGPVTIVPCSILDQFQIPEKSCQLALSMWSGFMEFNSEERELMLASIGRVLSDRGLFVVDLPSEYGYLDRETCSEYVYVQIKEPFGNLHGHLLSAENFSLLLERHGFELLESRHCYAAS